ncbi:MAG: hypothetical protein C0595_09440 [Marinilabiliales bacterium]|nr:MAG: hypothetical protein C0595_09440 [Marinilabiliales bacterium]
MNCKCKDIIINFISSSKLIKIMKKSIFLLLAISYIAISSCKKDAASPDIYGSWVVLQSDDQGQLFNVQLNINNDNTYDWILLDQAEGHGNSHASFTLSENILSIINDVDCEGVGEYYVSVESGKMSFIAKNESCSPRAKALEWVWRKYLED